jgi:hypothetical protein
MVDRVSDLPPHGLLRVFTARNLYRGLFVILPVDTAAAATYFGANKSAKDKSPKLTLDAP